MTTFKFVMGLAVSFLLLSNQVQAEGTFSTKSLTPATALKLATATMDECRADGYQVTVAIVDRHGNVQVMLRDRYAGPHTPDTAMGKAYAAATFKTNTSVLVPITHSGEEQFGVRQIPRAIIIAGGVIIQEGGELIGAMGVSGAPGGPADEACALRGLEAIEDDLDF